MQLQKLLKELVEDSGLEMEFRPRYSGRGMYGQTCVGIVGSKRDCMQVIKEAVKEAHDINDFSDDEEDDFDSNIDLLFDFEQDSMGRDIIIYWPTLKSNDIDDFLVGAEEYCKGQDFYDNEA